MEGIPTMAAAAEDPDGHEHETSSVSYCILLRLIASYGLVWIFPVVVKELFTDRRGCMNLLCENLWLLSPFLLRM